MLPDDKNTPLMVERISKALGVSSKFTYYCPVRVELHSDKGFHCVGRVPSYEVTAVAPEKPICFIDGIPMGMHIWKADQGNTLCWEVLKNDGEVVKKGITNVA